MTRRRGLMLSVTLLFCSSIFLFSEEIVRDYDRNFDFSGLRSYRWMELEHRLIMRADPQSKAEVSDEQIDRMIRSAVDAQLKKRGFVQSAGEDADFLVSYFAVGELDLTSSFYDAGGSGNLPYNHWRPFYQPSTDTRMNRKGTLTIDIVNPKNDQLIWRGQATDTIERTRDLEKVIKKVAGKVLSKFPPKG